MGLDGTNENWSSLAEDQRRQIEASMQPGETVVAWFQPNLTHELRFQTGLVVVTDCHIYSIYAEPHTTRGSDSGSPRIWPLAGGLRARELGGAGILELLTDADRLAFWRYTVSEAPAAHRLAHRFQAALAGKLLDTAEDKQERQAICPSCGGALADEDEVCPTCNAATLRPTASLFRLTQFARPRIGIIFLGLILTLASTAALLVPPYLSMPLIDRVLLPYQRGEAVPPGLLPLYLSGLAAASVLYWLLVWARQYVTAWASERISSDLRNKTYSHLQTLSLEYFGGKRTGDLISRVSSDTDKICNFLAINLIDFMSDVLMIVMTAIILLSLNAKLALVVLTPLPAIIWLVYWVRERLRKGFRQGGKAWADMVSVLADTIPGVRVVKAFAQESREVDRFQQTNVHVVETNDQVNKVWAFFYPMVTLMTDSGLLVVWIFGAYLIANQSVTVGMLQAFLAYMAKFYTKMESMVRMVSATQRAGNAATRIFEILDRVPSVAEPVKAIRPGRLNGRVEFRRVGFRYGSRPVLHDVNLDIAPGEMIGLVGASGSGKSTLINLVCRFYDVADGSIRVDGQDIRSFPVSEYRHNIGIVLQDPFLFYGTVAENISYGKPNATREEIVAAARAARAHEFILRLAEGYDSIVGERGQSLSGGERQRISIARALLIDPRILILDEATSSVDTETERQIQEALDNLIQGRTTIAIAHRLSTLRKADRLVVMDRGRVVEVGPHHELLQHEHGAYTRLHQAQLDMAQGLAAMAN